MIVNRPQKSPVKQWISCRACQVIFQRPLHHELCNQQEPRHAWILRPPSGGGGKRGAHKLLQKLQSGVIQKSNNMKIDIKLKKLLDSNEPQE
jgi:hypothetical protein